MTECTHKRIGPAPCEKCREHIMQDKLGLLSRSVHPENPTSWKLFDSTFDTIDEIEEFFGGYELGVGEEFLIFKVVGRIESKEDTDEIRKRETQDAEHESFGEEPDSVGPGASEERDESGDPGGPESIETGEGVIG